MAQENTLIIIKPDAVVKNLTGGILTRFFEHGFELLAAKCVVVSRSLAEEHYKALKEQPFFEEILKQITGHAYNANKVIAFVIKGEDAISRIRELNGATNPEEAAPNTIRGAFGRITTSGLYENVIHASESAEEAEREIKLWFRPEEIVEDLYPSKEVNQSIKQWT